MLDMPLTIVHNVDRHRFEATVDGQVARADYRLVAGVMRMYHTEVPRALEGRGIASALVRAAVSYAREHALHLRPDCPYVHSYMQRHPDTHELLPEDFEF
jgi:predicted GNAT family acetyltransferase